MPAVSEYSHISYKNSDDGVSIPSVKLDTFCTKERVNFIDAIKIDVEGAEMKVLKGLEKYLFSHKVGLLIIELNGDSYSYGNLHQDCINYLNGLGYLTFKISQQSSLQKINISANSATFNIIAFLEKNKKRIVKSLKTAYEY